LFVRRRIPPEHLFHLQFQRQRRVGEAAITLVAVLSHLPEAADPLSRVGSPNRRLLSHRLVPLAEAVVEAEALALAIRLLPPNAHQVHRVDRVDLDNRVWMVNLV